MTQNLIKKSENIGLKQLEDPKLSLNIQIICSVTIKILNSANQKENVKC